MIICNKMLLGAVVCVLFVQYGVRSLPVEAPAQWDVIIVGVGAAGASAASALAKAGRHVLVLEAQPRIGGRVYTVPFGDGVVELGGEWIQGTENSTVYDLAVQNNITLVEDNSRFVVYHSDGSFANQSLIDELLEKSREFYENPPRTPEPLGQYTTKKLLEYISSTYPELAKDSDFIEGFLGWLEQTILSSEAANSWNDVSTMGASVDLGGHQSTSWHRHGYKTFFDILLNTYKDGPGLPNLEIKLNTEVTNISWPQEPAEDVVVTTADGAVYKAKHVIVTMSLGVLKERYQSLFTPGLPEAKITAIKNISMGILGKIIFSFNERWWKTTCGQNYCNNLGFMWKKKDRDAVEEEDKWLIKIQGASMPLGSSNTVTFWTNGEAAKRVEQLSEEVVSKKIMGMARQFLGDNFTIPEPTGMLKSNWYSNPFTRGTYTYDNVLTPQHLNARAILGEPLLDRDGRPRVLFAGEATEPNHFGYVHGASETGFREAKRLLALK